MSNDPASKQFSLGDVLTVATGRLLTRRGMSGVYDILNFMTGDDLYTHQIPRALEECGPHMRRQHPQVVLIEVPEVLESQENVWSWLASQEAVHGDSFCVTPIPAEDHASIDPLTELAQIAGDKPIVVVTSDA